VISVFGPDTLQRIKSLKNSNAAMVCVVNRRYEFDPVELVNEKGGSRSARIEGESDCFLDIVSANDEAIGQDFSSTIIRQALLQNQLEKCQHLLHPVVIEYIKEKRLFSPLGRKGYRYLGRTFFIKATMVLSLLSQITVARQ
jgi:nicotinic acid mononucleotide adenylyltransferase